MEGSKFEIGDIVQYTGKILCYQLGTDPCKVVSVFNSHGDTMCTIVRLKDLDKDGKYTVSVLHNVLQDNIRKVI